MQYITSGIPKIPQELTKQAILALSSHEMSSIQNKFFAIQVVNISYDNRKSPKKNLKKIYYSSNIDVSDGIGIATAIIQKEIYDEMILNDQQITQYCILVVKGDIFRQSGDDGKTGFIFNETPRLVINDVEGQIGDPQAFVKACQQNKYADIQTKYSENFFRIPYTQQFFNRYILKTNPLTCNKEQTLQLVDKISDLQDNQYRNKVILPHLPDTNITFIILSYAFYLHKAKILLRRLSRTGFNMGTCTVDTTAQFDRFQKKLIEIPISSNQTFVVCSHEFEKYYLVRENNFNYLQCDHQDVYALRTICPITNLGNLKNLKILHHPYLFTNFTKENLQIDEVKGLLDNDQLEEFSFEMRYDSPDFSKIFQIMKQCQRLKKLTVNVNLKAELIDVLNKFVGKDSNFKSLSVNFTNPQASDNFEVKFHKYLKNLRSLNLKNVADKNFSETMFDMACIRKLKELSLSFIHDLSLPNFSEALSKFTNLHSLTISQISYLKVNAQILLNFISDGAQNLRILGLDNISLNDDQFKHLLTAISKSKSLRELKLTSIHLDTDFKLEFLTGFIGSKQTMLSKIILSENQLTNLDILSQMFLNKSLKELIIISQTFFTKSSKLTEQDVKHSKENQTVDKLNLEFGVMKTIKPLIRCLSIFTRLKDLSICHVDLDKLHFQVIDNYLIQNPVLQKLTLKNVKMGYDQFIILAGTIRNSKKLKKLNLSSNQLRNLGCTEVANVLVSNTSIRTINLDNNDIKEPGLVALLKVLEQNKSLVKLRLENNKFMISRQLLGLIGNVFVYRNKSLRYLIMTFYGKTLLRKEQDDGNEFDRDMIMKFMNEIQTKSNLKAFTI